MKFTENKTLRDFQFLYKKGYKCYSEVANGDLFASLNYQSETSALIFNFTIEKGVLSVALTTKYILTNKAINKFNKMFDLLYIVKLLNPDSDFLEIREINEAEEVMQKFSEIEFLFNDENVLLTIKEINRLEKEYSN